MTSYNKRKLIGLCLALLLLGGFVFLYGVVKYLMFASVGGLAGMAISMWGLSVIKSN